MTKELLKKGLKIDDDIRAVNYDMEELKAVIDAFNLKLSETYMILCSYDHNTDRTVKVTLNRDIYNEFVKNVCKDALYELEKLNAKLNKELEEL